jgi:hypothetical protein
MTIHPTLPSLGLALCLAAPAVAFAGAPPTVNLLEAGSGPKAPLRYAPEAGSKTTVTMTMNMTASASFGDQAMPPQVVPPITMTMDTEVSEVSGDSFTLGFRYSSVELGTAEGAPPGTAEAMKQMLDELVGLEGHSTMSSRGFVTDGSFVPKEGASPQVQEIAANFEKSINQLAAPLPAEPVGVGARWEVLTDVESGGITVSQRAEYTLKARNGDNATMDVKVTQSAAEQTITTPQGSAKLLSMTATGSGATTLSIKGALPVDATSDTSIAMKMSMDMNGQAIVMDMTTVMGLAVSAKSRK